MGTPNYPRDFTDDVRDLRVARTAALTAGQSRVPYEQASQGLILPDLPTDPPAPASGVRLYAKDGRLYYRASGGTVYGPL
ncbi:hypothetical protein FHS43_000577 [Streptosporangium becharense]|uniref:Uncharacterized protein n=1 Tax=Streptosporangium becharense TaxID=1816182 RepID=A0A7W9MKI7_9ACTN|nr:hypothetical protein [Streptosporangium becharense]MBB2909331.1 hypothetical protein [Streptosporangium becharense]MBB5823766.1 hypothetical protein [Streptosporangium becharense]